MNNKLIDFEDVLAVDAENEENERVEINFFVSELSALKKGHEAYCIKKHLPRLKEEAMAIANKCDSEITVKDYGDDYYGIIINKLYEARTAKRVRKRSNNSKCTANEKLA